MKIAALCLCFSLCVTAASAQIAHLSFTSDPGDFIGLGQTRDMYYTPLNSTYFPMENVGIIRPLTGVGFTFGTVGDRALPFASVSFSTRALNIPFQIGTYLDAQRAPFAAPGHPGLDVTFDNRGSNTLTGFFVVRDLQYDSLNINHFLVDFEQHSEGSVPALRGTFEFSSSTWVSAVPEPSTYALSGFLFILILVAFRRIRHTKT